MYIAAHKPALYAAALCSVLPLVMGAKVPTHEDVIAPPSESLMQRYMNERRNVKNEARLNTQGVTGSERNDPAPAPVRADKPARCDLVATLPSGAVICFHVRW